jgi:hypothetical protein
MRFRRKINIALTHARNVRVLIQHLGSTIVSYFGVSEAASFWKRGSFRSGSNIGSSRNSAGVSAEVVRKVFALLFRRERGDDLLKARIAAERVPHGIQLEIAISNPTGDFR